MKSRYFVELAYKGSNYHGWQIQPNAMTVQERLGSAFSTILRETIQLIGAGRTDTGVHARHFVAHFDIERDFDAKTLIRRLNSFLPSDIAICNIYPVKNDAHSRFDATARTYKYFISTIKNPFNFEFAYFYRYPLDIEAMNRAAEILFEYNDFTSFAKLHTDTKTNLCEIKYAKWKRLNHDLIFTITADRFLRNMVRAIVGTMIDIGKGNISDLQFRDIIEAKDRSGAGSSAPPQGLFLENIEYPSHLKPKKKNIL